MICFNLSKHLNCNRERRETMTKEEIQSISFKIISYAGDAFAKFYEAVEVANEGEYEKAEQLIQEGDNSMHEAHKAQMDLLAVEANGEDMDFSVILVHAQDHLMTTIMYERIAKQLISVLKKMEK